MHTSYMHTYIIHAYIHTCVHTCVHAYMCTCIHAGLVTVYDSLLFGVEGLGVAFLSHTQNTHTHRVFQGEAAASSSSNLKLYCIRERLRERVVRTQHRGQHGRWTTHAGVCTCIGARETSLSDSRGWGASARLEGRDSTCREAGANLLSSTVVVSDCVSLYLSGASARADVALPP